MELAVFRMKDYAKVTQAWWYKWHGVPVSELVLSRFGVAILEGETPLAIAYLYPCPTSSMVYLGWTVRDPYISSYKAGKALKLLIEGAETETRRLGYAILYSSYDSPALKKLMIKRGYYKGADVTEYFKEIA